MPYYLGIFGGQGPNPSAALLRDNRLLAVAEEERFTRQKCAPSNLPINAIEYCLSSANINMEEIVSIGFGWDCPHYAQNSANFLNKIKARFDATGDRFNALHEQRIRIGFDPERIERYLYFGLAKKGISFDSKKLVFLKHHLCHAASTFYASDFDEASILTIDGSGEEFTCVLWYGKDGKIEQIKAYELPDSLGGFFGTFTEFLGFKVDEEEGKLMGLAPYGNYCQDTQNKLSRILNFDKETGDFQVNPMYRFYGERQYGSHFTEKLVELFGKPRLRNDPIEEHHKIIAYNVQWRLEQVVIALVKNLIRMTGCANVCLAGGVAMNCKANGLVAMLDEVEQIFVQPAASDNGIALGAAYLMAKADGVSKFDSLEHCYWGPSYVDESVEAALKEAKISYHRSRDIVAETAGHLARGRIVGWFQGAMEVGARALGNRSILASPLIKEMREKLNTDVKHRENWRPFCPSIAQDSYYKYFGNVAESKFMILAFPIKPGYSESLPAAVHVDGSVRPQSVSKEMNSRFYSLLKEFGKISGHDVLINTSFNVQGEPIVNTPGDAIRCFGGTGIDILAIGNFISEKPTFG